MAKVVESGTITSFTYDGDGGRVRKTTDDGRGTTNSTTYIGSLFEIRETTDEGRRTIKHIFAGANRVCTLTKDEARQTTDASYYHSDHLGSSSIITDASGQQVEHYEYTPYGTIAAQELVPRPSSLIPRDTVHHKFTGKELDSTGLYFYGARYYDPEVGRFISADTIVGEPYNPQSLNRYAYCYNNPVNYIDPSGHLGFLAQLIWAVILIAASWGAAQAGAEVHGEAGVSIPFDTGPSSSPSYSSSNPAPSAPQASNAGTNSSASSGDSQSFGAPSYSEQYQESFSPTTVNNFEESHKDVSLWNRSLSSLWIEFKEDFREALIRSRDPQQTFNFVLGFSGGTKFVGGRGTAAQIAKRIVIGEGSRRVEEKALAVGAEHYVPRYRLPKNPTLAQIGRVMKSNYQWLKSKVKQGYEIIDIGIDKARAERGIFYEAEKRWLKIWGK